MQLDATKTVREVALAIPNATRVFEKIKIDYCCGGDRLLGDACARAGVQINEVERLLNENVAAI
jgi:regulator of cell morphogenesis and NO signaling